MNFGRKMKALRYSRGLLQSDLAELTGLNERVISQIETGLLNIEARPEWAAAIRTALSWGPAEDQALAILAGETVAEVEREVA